MLLEKQQKGVGLVGFFIYKTYDVTLYDFTTVSHWCSGLFQVVDSDITPV